MMREALQRIAKIRQHSFASLFRLLAVWVILGLARAAVVFLPFERIIELVGLSSRACPATPRVTLRQRETARQLGLTILKAARYSPWVANCLPQAICAAVLLRLYKVPFAVFLGLLRDDKSGQVLAHAWTCAGDIPVTGGGDPRTYAIVGCFDLAAKSGPN